MQFEKGRKGGWAVLAELSEYDGTNDHLLEPYSINMETLIYSIQNIEQPPNLNAKMVEAEL